jgi:hypothetical protein
MAEFEEELDFKAIEVAESIYLLLTVGTGFWVLQPRI